MPKKQEPLMEIRDLSADWPDDPETDYVVRWTDRGWASLERAGFLPDARSFIDGAASLLLLDLEEAIKQERPSAIKVQLKKAQKRASDARSCVRAALRAYQAISERPEELVRALDRLAAIENDLAAVNVAEHRKSREPIYEYFRLVDAAARECGIPLKRSTGPIQLAKHIRDAVAPCAKEYLTALEHLDKTRAEEAAAVLRQVSPEGVIREATKGKGRTRSSDKRNVPVSDSDRLGRLTVGGNG
jgi:hypothetical protein